MYGHFNCKGRIQKQSDQLNTSLTTTVEEARKTYISYKEPDKLSSLVSLINRKKAIER
ncbi:hypothetical protein OROMI_001402 [Orobanche minor]